jgi:prolyl-tRNA synthetase
VRAGYIRQLAAGIYSYLFLGNRSFNKIMAIVREEMDKIGQEFFLPALHPREIWEASGRWDLMGDNLFRLKDRKGADLALGMTEEEVMTDDRAQGAAQLQAVAADLVPDRAQVSR